MNERVKILRKSLDLSQESFANKLGVTKATISRIEKGVNNLTEQMIKSICREFKVNEDWFRYGTGNMINEPDEFSLDEYVKSKGATDLELLLIKSFFEIPKNIRTTFLNYFERTITDNIVQNEYVATAADEIAKYTTEHEKEDVAEDIRRTLLNQMYINKELEAYKQELEAETKEKKSSASGKPKGA